MGRPAAICGTAKGHYTKNELAIREEMEENLKGRSDRLEAPAYLSEDQKEIFDYIVSEMEESGLFGNLDVYYLTQFAICTDRLAELEMRQNISEEERFSKVYITARNTYSKDFHKCAVELGLSPQARGKISGLAAQKKEQDKNPILDIIGDVD